MLLGDFVCVSSRFRNSLEPMTSIQESLEGRSSKARLTGFIVRGLEIKPYDDASIG
jgi:hypothetical protein